MIIISLVKTNIIMNITNETMFNFTNSTNNTGKNDEEYCECTEAKVFILIFLVIICLSLAVFILCCGYMCVVENCNCCVKNLLSCFRVRSRESRIHYYIENNYRDSDTDSDSDNDSDISRYETNLEKQFRLKNDSYKTMTYGDNSMGIGKTCSICLEEFEDSEDKITIIKTNCGHIFHEKCVEHKSIINCPLCREPFRYQNFINILSI